jgi:aspartate kinase
MSEVAVVKIGGSVFIDRLAYGRVAAHLRARVEGDPAARLVVVVSAEFGHTDALLDEARSLATEPDAAALDLLWSTGELRSVALLTLSLRAAGVDATAFNVHATGLSVESGSDRLVLNPLALRGALARHAIVVVPGFLATRGPRVVTLGRGGSDWSAVMLAAALGASRCELIKDVDGYFTDDPHASKDAQLIPALDYDEALRMADAGCPLVQRQAIAAAAAARLPIVVRSLHSQGTFVHHQGVSRLTSCVGPTASCAGPTAPYVEPAVSYVGPTELRSAAAADRRSVGAAYSGAAMGLETR